MVEDWLLGGLGCLGFCVYRAFRDVRGELVGARRGLGIYNGQP